MTGEYIEIARMKYYIRHEYGHEEQQVGMVRHDISSLPQKIKGQGDLSAQSAYIMKLTITTDIYKASTDPEYSY